MFFAEDFPGAVFLRAAPQPFGPDEPDGLAETRDVMKADTAPAVAHSDNPAGGATRHGLVGFDMDNQAGRGLSDGGDMHARDTQKSIGTFTPPPAGAGSKWDKSGFLLKMVV